MVAQRRAMESLELMSPPLNAQFWRGKRVWLTGHTGFKGAWCALWLREMGADVHGFALAPDTTPNLFDLVGAARDLKSCIGDIRDLDAVRRAAAAADPEIVLHMAAQPLVRRSIREPVETFAANVMGTAHVLEALRDCARLKAVLIVTTDKVYENAETGRSFRESDPLGGHDPYSASKAAAEIVAASYSRTYFSPRGVALATARGGNVIGGGDFSADRLVPDIYRALQAGDPLVLRYPEATRPWQHVLDCVGGYLAYAQALGSQGAARDTLPRALNFGPLHAEQVPVRALAEAMQTALGATSGWRAAEAPQPREMQALSLDCTAARQTLGFTDHLVGAAAIEATADWYLAFARGDDMRAVTLRAIQQHMRA